MTRVGQFTMYSESTLRYSSMLWNFLMTGHHSLSPAANRMQSADVRGLEREREDDALALCGVIEPLVETEDDGIEAEAEGALFRILHACVWPKRGSEHEEGMTTK